MASITYYINSKHDDQGIRKAKEGIESLGSSVRNLTNIFKGLIGVLAFREIAQFVSDTIEAFQTQQKALSALTISIQNNANLTGKSLQNIINFTQKLQKHSIYGDEELQKQAAFLAGLGLTENQIKNVLEASVNLASAGIMPLENAAKNLAKTYSGTAGELGSLIPAVKNLTTEQLASGEAVSIINKQFQNMMEAASQTLEGRTKQIANIIGDIKEKLGGLFGIAKLELLERMRPILEGIDEWLSKNMSKIINFFINLPQIVSIAGKSIWGIMKKIFTFEYIYNSFSNVADLIYQVFVLLLKTIWNTLQAVSATIWYPLKYGFDQIAYGIQSVFAKIVNFFVTGIQWVLDKINSALEFIGQGDKKIKLDIQQIGGPEKPKLQSAEISNAWEKIGTDFTTQLNMIGESAGKFWHDATGPLTIASEALKEISDVLERQLPDKYTKTLFPETTYTVREATGVPIAPEIANLGYGHGFEGETVPVSQVSAIGEVFNYIKQTFMGIVPTFDSLLGAVQPLIDMFFQINSIRLILNPLQIVFQAILKTLQPVIDSLLKPLIGIFQIIGQTIGKMLIPLIMQLSPIIKLVSQAFIFIYNYALRPFGNAVIWLIVTINNMIANVVNAVIRALNKIPFVRISWRMETMSFDQMKLQSISEADLTSAGTEAMQQSAIGASATYTGVRDVTINIYFEHSFVNGDARAIALALRDEIRYAEKLGY